MRSRRGVQIQLPADCIETAVEHCGVSTFSSLPDAEAVVITTTAASFAHQAHHVRRATGQVSLQPLCEYLLQFMRQAQQNPRRLADSTVGGTADDVLYFGIIECRNYRCEQQADRDACGRKFAHQAITDFCSWHAWLEDSLEIRIHRGDADGNRHQVPSGQVGQDIEVPGHQAALADQADGVAKLQERFKHITPDQGEHLQTWVDKRWERFQLRDQLSEDA